MADNRVPVQVMWRTELALSRRHIRWMELIESHSRAAEQEE